MWGRKESKILSKIDWSSIFNAYFYRSTKISFRSLPNLLFVKHFLWVFKYFSKNDLYLYTSMILYVLGEWLDLRISLSNCKSSQNVIWVLEYKYFELKNSNFSPEFIVIVSYIMNKCLFSCIMYLNSLVLSRTIISRLWNKTIPAETDV